MSSHNSGDMLSYFVVMRSDLGISGDRQGRVIKLVSGSRMTHFHRHDELEFNLVLRGSSSYLLDKRRYWLGPDTVVWLFPQQEHMLLDCSPDFEMWIAVFCPALLRQICTSPSYQILLEGNPPSYFCRRIAEPQTARLHRLLAELDDADLEPTLLNTGLAYVLALAWTIHSTTSDVPRSADVHPAVENAVYLLKKDPRAGDLATLASRAGLSPGRLSRLFKQQIGVSMVQFRNRLRVERYVELYRKGRRKTVLQAALEAGFGSYPQFHREFVRVMGCSPTSFQRWKR